MKVNEWYPNGPMVAPGAISMTKVKNLLKKGKGYVAENFSNIRVNGQLRGSCGFVRKAGSDKIVYVDTEVPAYGREEGSVLVRYAKSTKDYCGETNFYCYFSDLLEFLDHLFS